MTDVGERLAVVETHVAHMRRHQEENRGHLASVAGRVSRLEEASHHAAKDRAKIDRQVGRLEGFYLEVKRQRDIAVMLLAMAKYLGATVLLVAYLSGWLPKEQWQVIAKFFGLT